MEENRKDRARIEDRTIFVAIKKEAEGERRRAKLWKRNPRGKQG